MAKTVKTAVAAAVAAATAAETYGFRVVVRGNEKDGRRVRRVKTIQCTDFGHAMDEAGPVAEDASKGLSNVHYAVYPPVGLKCNGAPSKGWKVANDGSLVPDAQDA